MSTAREHSSEATIPVSDVSRAKEFYASLGWRLDATPPVVVQLTPPGSGCSVQFGPDRTPAALRSAQGLFLIVSDIEAARDRLAASGVESEAYHIGTDGRISGVDPKRRRARRALCGGAAHRRRRRPVTGPGHHRSEES